MKAIPSSVARSTESIDTALPSSDNVADKRVMLTINYTGFLNDQMAGFYRSTYQDMDGRDRIMASTQFESLDARRAFPCVDEPAAKATFTLHLTIPTNRQALSNMPTAAVVRLNATTHRVSFLPTPKLST